MEGEKIDLSHQTEIREAFSKLQVEISEYSFASLYLFRKKYDYTVWHNGVLLIQGKTYDGFTFLMPTSMEGLQSKTILQELGADFFFPIPEDWLSSTDFSQITSMEAENDYIYDVETLSHYPGRHLSKKRNLVKQFHELYGDMHAVPLDASCKDAARQVLEHWKGHVAIEADYHACLDAIELLEALHLEGKVYYVGSLPVGFVIGEAINSQMFVIHFAKANSEYKGIYQYLFQDFAGSLEGQYKWINMEQDLGVPALRQSKHSYEPARLCKKYRVN